MAQDFPLPDGWEWTTLSEICFIQSGVGFPKTLQGLTSGDFPLAKVSDITEAVKENGAVISRANNYLSAVEAKSLGAKIFPEGTTIFAKIGEAIKLNRRAISAVPILADNNVMGLIPDKENVVPKFLFYFMLSIDLYEYSQATIVPSVRKSDVENISLPLPPLPEQERIVAKIEELFSQLEAGTAALRRVQAGLKRYKASVLKAACEGRLVEQDRNDGDASELLNNLVKGNSKKKRAGRLWGSGTVPEISKERRLSIPRNWMWAKVKDLGIDPEDTVQVGPMSMKSSEFEDVGVPVLNVGTVQWGYFETSKLNYLPIDKVEKFDRYRIKSGDVMFTRSGTVGRCAVVRESQDGWLMTFHLLRVRPDKNKCLPDFLRIVFEGAPHIRKQTRDASIGTTRAGFNTNLLAMLDIPIPPLAEQHRIVAEVERRLSVVAEIEAAVDAGLKRAERLRQAILKQAFEGKLVAQEAGEEPIVRAGAEPEYIQPPLL